MGNVIKGKNDLESLDPKLVEEWNYEKNSINPCDISANTHMKVWWKCRKEHEWQASVANRHRKKQKCPYCTGRLAITGVNDLATTNPELLLEWDYSKNVSIDPTLVKAGSCKKAWWKCVKGHEWETKILNRAIKGHGCIYCSSNKVLFGYNDFLTQYPELAEEWDYEKNLEINPQELQVKSNLKVWWKCKHCGHSWQAYISNRTSHNSSCPKCNFKLKTSFPEQVIFYYINVAA